LRDLVSYAKQLSPTHSTEKHYKDFITCKQGPTP
jgi:hypothetical protein